MKTVTGLGHIREDYLRTYPEVAIVQINLGLDDKPMGARAWIPEHYDEYNNLIQEGWTDWQTNPPWIEKVVTFFGQVYLFEQSLCIACKEYTEWQERLCEECFSEKQFEEQRKVARKADWDRRVEVSAAESEQRERERVQDLEWQNYELEQENNRLKKA